MLKKLLAKLKSNPDAETPIFVSLPPANAPGYQYRATLSRVIDGDTIELHVDLGFGITLHQEVFRLYGINAPEVRGSEKEAGLAATKAVRDFLLGADLVVKTIKPKRGTRDSKGKYGRYLAEIYKDNQCLNDWLVYNGFANYVKY